MKLTSLIATLYLASCASTSKQTKPCTGYVKSVETTFIDCRKQYEKNLEMCQSYRSNLISYASCNRKAEQIKDRCEHQYSSKYNTECRVKAPLI